MSNQVLLLVSSLNQLQVLRQIIGNGVQLKNSWTIYFESDFILILFFFRRNVIPQG